jgi:hypothetical protein
MEFHSDIARKFEIMGARVRLGELKPFWRLSLEDIAAFRLDIGNDRVGQFFDLRLNSLKVTRLLTLDVRPGLKHLVLMCSEHFQDEEGKWQDRDHRVLCGHDEREWFCAAIPESRRVTTVVQAMEALMPSIAPKNLVRQKVRGKDRLKRRNKGFKRQGEWFFVPDPVFHPRDAVYHLNEPLIRGNGKPHDAEYLVRHGGKSVYVRRWGNRIVTEGELRRLLRVDPREKAGNWVLRVEEPVVHVKGKIRHPDHATLVLDGWHRVEPNTEEREVGRNRRITFID